MKRIEGAKREVVEKALEGMAFGHLSELVQFVEETLRS